MELFQTLFTLFGVVFFTGVVLWAYNGKRKAEFDAAARLPLGDDSKPPLN
jgi:cytochrome c oxidase cbb3-type subunit 4